ncbi:MAG: helix-turn-helix domain-containing protein [Candidatus Thorarchaeota archaeon]
MSSLSGLPFRVVRQKPLNHEFLKSSTDLTERQREVVRLAAKVGYFEIPRRTSSEKIAEMLGISRAAFLEHLRKIEKRIFTRIAE